MTITYYRISPTELLFLTTTKLTRKWNVYCTNEDYTQQWSTDYDYYPHDFINKTLTMRYLEDSSMVWHKPLQKKVRSANL